MMIFNNMNIYLFFSTLHSLYIIKLKYDYDSMSKMLVWEKIIKCIINYSFYCNKTYWEWNNTYVEHTENEIKTKYLRLGIKIDWVKISTKTYILLERSSKYVSINVKFFPKVVLSWRDI